MRAALALALLLAVVFACGPAARAPVDDEEGTPGHSQFFPTSGTARADGGHDAGSPDHVSFDAGVACGKYVCQPGWVCVAYSGVACGQRETVCVPNCAGMSNCQCAALNGHGCECNGGKCESSDGGAYAWCRDRVADAG